MKNGLIKIAEAHNRLNEIFFRVKYKMRTMTTLHLIMLFGNYACLKDRFVFKPVIYQVKLKVKNG